MLWLVFNHNIWENYLCYDVFSFALVVYEIVGLTSSYLCMKVKSVLLQAFFGEYGILESYSL
jgi:hypothetical protein